MRTIYWVRTDLRLHDNHALNQFCRLATEGAVIWCPSPTYLRALETRKRFIQDCLSHFSESLSSQVWQGDRPFLQILNTLVSTFSVEQIIFTREFATEENTEEKQVVEQCKKLGVKTVMVDQATLIAENDLPFSLSDMPRIFTQFRKQIEDNLKVGPLISSSMALPRSIDLNCSEIAPTKLPADQELIFHGGEKQALARLEHYLWTTHSVSNYKNTRNGMLKWDDSTKFSAWLSQGCLSARKIYHELKRYESSEGANESTYWVIFELLWRDYFKFLSRKYQNKIFRESGLVAQTTPPHPDSESRFDAWKSGKTQNAFINANMNELRETGFMSNRGRQNVASYLIHHLQVPWTWGASYFESTLIDYDPDLNWGNWLYLSGKGTDPRSRVFNPILQASQYDPEQEYQRKWGRNTE